MRDTLEIGSSPYEEDCAQVGQADYAEQAHRECNALINQLRRVFGFEPEGARLRIKSNAHDFGTYYEVACSFDGENQAATQYAYRVEGNTPARWDAEARKELGLPDEDGVI